MCMCVCERERKRAFVTCENFLFLKRINRGIFLIINSYARTMYEMSVDDFGEIKNEKK